MQTNKRIDSATNGKLLLIAFVHQDLETNQKLGWKIIKDSDIAGEAKKKYNLLITDINCYKIPDNECTLDIRKRIEKNSDSTFFVIANEEQCWFNVWKLSDDKESILEKLSVGNGP